MSRPTLEELYGRLALWERRLPIHSEWRHYGGDVYEIVGFGIDEDTGEVEVQYRRSILRHEPLVRVSFGSISPDLITFHRLASKWQEDVTVHRGQLIPVNQVARMTPEQRLALANENVTVPRFTPVERIESFVEITRA